MSSEKKNLLLMVPMLHQGGFERVCIKTARLMQEFYNVHILIFSSKDINFDITGLDVIDIDVPAQKGIVNKVINVLKRVKKTKKVKKNLGIDISYSFGSSANYVNVLSKGKEKVLTGLRCQTDMDNKKNVRLFCNRSDQVLSCSKEIVRELERDYSYNRSTYIYNPLDVSDVQDKGAEEIKDYPFNEPDVKVISCMGRNDYIKGIWHLVKAFSLVEKAHPEARLIVLGAGDWSDYRDMAWSLGIKEKVAFPGVRKNPFPYVAKSDVYVCSSNHEGFPNAVLEAMALKKPLISADCKTGPREILLNEEQYNALIKEIPNGDSITKPIEGEFGILVPDMSEEVNMDPEDISDEERVLADQIIALLDSDEKMKHYSEKAYERALFYTPEKYQASAHEIFKRYE
ncbi:Glycosyltransferase involved in cell wall bisynthesis [Butyrivibrio hungatei DSM 14810]|uniref:Glycosyltransferase involved in cell wall bisynthesis n=1 Tax=Butyrivibrio hungatei DSM 14810 TaxID=1121132 RepID=A0A1M7S0A2_9FIRM|nr:glycosyltransferase [Butyrivibrio hungatei]SHN51742.1 Glycosyltransferase involved in cell wall bisynthesis [Butyrivibrio hungatei DSM 14810]